MKTRRIVTWVILTLVPLAGLNAAGVFVRLHQPPPGQLQYEDLWWVDIDNRTGRTIERVWLHGEVTEATHGSIFSANSNEFQLPPGRRTIRSRDIAIRDPHYAEGYEVFVRRTGNLPEGTYTYIVTLMPDLAGDTQRVQVGRPGAPRLISPPDGATLRVRSPLFDWAGPLRGQREIAYALKIVEVMRGQTPEEAMLANRPWFSQGGIMATSFRYPRAARSFERGRHYAWQVYVTIGREIIARSEIWGFVTEISGGGPGGPSIDIYFADGGEGTGSVYHRTAAGAETAVYTRSSGRLYTFLFAPWDTTKLYFVNANEFKIYVKDLAAATPEAVAYAHPTYVRDIEVGKDGAIYFSEATGAGGDGKIWKLGAGGSATLFYTVKLSTVDGSWTGDFTFDYAGVLYLSSGNRVPASLYRVDVAANTVTKLYTDPGEAITGMMFGNDGLLYYGNWAKKIYALDLATSTKSAVYDNAARTWVSDVRFKTLPTPITTPPGATTWVLPWSVGGIRIDGIKPTGLINYNDGASGISMVDAPFGGYLGFSHGNSPNIPSAAIKYFHWEYNRDSTGWVEMTDPVYAYYVVDIPYNPPTIQPYRLGPNLIDGKQLYEFKPDTSLLPRPPGARAYWFSSGLMGQEYSGFFSSGAPGNYAIRLSVFNPGGTQVMPGLGTFRFVAPDTTGSGGTIHTHYASDLTDIEGGGYRFRIRVDNRLCSAFVYTPHMDTVTVADECGMMRYDTTDTNPVTISYHASHPANFAVHSFFIIRGINTVPTSQVSGAEVTANPAGVYVRDAGGNFTYGFPLATMFGPKCTEAAFSENLYLYAKATTGNGYRITSYDRSFVRAFAMAKKK